MHTRTKMYPQAMLITLLFILPAIARADSFTYTFSSDVAHFTFTEASLLTMDQTLSISPITIQGATFTYASLVFTGGEQCFLFGTTNVTGNCNTVSESSPFSLFGAYFPNVNGVGTYIADAAFCARSDLAQPCVFPNQAWSLTISQITVPETSTFPLVGTGVIGLLGMALSRQGRHFLVVALGALPASNTP